MAITSSQWIKELPTDRLIGEFSVWSADLGSLASELRRIDGHADMLHIDVSDGHFAPQMLFFPDLASVVRKHSGLPMHVHLMVADDILLSQIEQFAEAGADLVSIHVETSEKVADRALARINELGIAAGLVLTLESEVEAATPFLDRVQFLTMVATQIGIKGIGPDDRACDRLRMAKQIIASRAGGHRIVLAADGGIREHTVPKLYAAGAETIVMGSLAFGAPDLSACMKWVHGL